GPTNHAIILVRSLNVPAVVGLTGAAQLVSPEQVVALDGATGEVVVDPTPEALERWRRRASSAAVLRRDLESLRDRPATTADGQRVRLLANLEIADEVARVRDAGAEGIGLFRSEFLLDPSDPEAPDEEGQLETYRG